MTVGSSNSYVSATPSRLSSGWRRPVAAGIDLLFPPRCTVCGSECEPALGSPLFCDSCAKQLALSERPSCPRCALRCSESDVAQGNCRDCRNRKLLFVAARTIGPYENNLRQAVLQTKHASYEPLATALGQRLAEAIIRRPFDEQPELVAPVPVYWLKRLWRKTHTAATIAQAVARELGLPLAANLLVCRRYLRRQAILTPTERRKNVRGAFRTSLRWRRRIIGKRILLVDDVMTTGATAHEAARAMLAAGAAAVYVATVARSSAE
jgi:ComF family protein